MTRLFTHDGTPASRFAFGTMQFGGGADEGDSRAMFDACLAHGVNHFDTAYVYTDGASETLLGQMIGKARDSVFIATKFGAIGGAGRKTLTDQFETSCARLGLEEVDLLYLHMFDPETDLRDTMEGFAELKQVGRIRYVGLSNFAAWQVMKAVRVAAEFGLGIDVLQPMYNLVKRQAEVEILPMCADQDILPVPYSPLGGGLLTGKYARGDTGRIRTDMMYVSRYREGWMHDSATALAALAQDIGTDPATLAVAWVAAHASHPVPIISARTAEQLQPSLAALDFEMSDALYARISALSPTPPPATDRSETGT